MVRIWPVAVAHVSSMLTTAVTPRLSLTVHFLDLVGGCFTMFFFAMLIIDPAAAWIFSNNSWHSIAAYNEW